MNLALNALITTKLSSGIVANLFFLKGLCLKKKHPCEV